MKIPIAKTEFTNNEFKAIRKPIESGWVVQGPFVQEFEDKWSAFTSAKNSIAVTSCTTALHLSLKALGVGPGDEVIVPAFTWIATANVVEDAGANVVFCDIDLKTFNINTNQVYSKITTNTIAIIPVHLFGLAADMKPILKLAKENNLLIIEDAACGFGAKYKGTHVGNLGNTACFSFHPRKAITTGEGGMITTNDDELAVKLRALRDHGATTSDLQRHLGGKPYLLPEFPYAGYNYRMTDIQASIGSTQMDRAEKILSDRIKIAESYDELFKSIPWLISPDCEKPYAHGYQSYTCLFSPEEITMGNVKIINSMRNKFMDYLQEKGISTRPGTHSVPHLQFYRNKYNFTEKDYPNSWIADQCSIAFPIFPSMTTQEIDYIATTIKAYVL